MEKAYITITKKYRMEKSQDVNGKKSSTNVYIKI